MCIIVNKKILFGLFLLLSGSAVFAGDIQFKITNKNPQIGTLHLELYNVPINLEHSASWQHIVSVAHHTVAVDSHKKSQGIVLKNIDLDVVCVRAFLDLNGNETLDKSASGLPKEPVGFANNPPLMFGEPLPSDACIDLVNNESPLHIKLQQKKRKKA